MSTQDLLMKIVSQDFRTHDGYTRDASSSGRLFIMQTCLSIAKTCFHNEKQAMVCLFNPNTGRLRKKPVRNISYWRQSTALLSKQRSQQ